MKAFRRASYGEQKKIEALLLKVLKKRDDGFYFYEAGWDDEKVAKTIDPKLTNAHTVTVRKELDMKMVKGGVVGGPNKISNYADLNARVVKLERLVKKLCDEFGIREDKEEANGQIRFPLAAAE